MAEGLITKPAFVDALVNKLQASLAEATIDAERVRGDRYRLVVVAPFFDQMGHPERQRFVWDLAEQTLPASDLRNVSMIITMAPDEVG